jgi:hypothetical protein
VPSQNGSLRKRERQATRWSARSRQRERQATRWSASLRKRER